MIIRSKLAKNELVIAPAKSDDKEGNDVNDNRVKVEKKNEVAAMVSVLPQIYVTPTPPISQEGNVGHFLPIRFWHNLSSTFKTLFLLSQKKVELHS